MDSQNLTAACTPQPHDLVPATALPQALKPFAEVAGKPAPTYRQGYVKILDGLIPAQKIGKQWFVKRGDLPSVAQVMGLVAETVKSPEARACRAPSATLAA